MKDKFFISGININQVENLDTIKNFTKYFQCCICLNILYNPVHCLKCDTLMCQNCLSVLQLANKECLGKCKGSFAKPNKYVREILSDLRISCESCKGKFKYKEYFTHIQNNKCDSNGNITHSQPTNMNDFPCKEKMLNLIKDIDDKILSLNNEVDKNKISMKIYHKQNYDKYLKASGDELREYFVTNVLPVSKKMEMYNACTSGDLEEFKNMVLTKKYPLLEEVSCIGYYWTSLHYAMHYGQFDIISFIFLQLLNDNIFEPVLKLQSNDSRCPMLCLLKSNYLSNVQKEVVFDKLLTKFNVPISQEVKKEAHVRNFDSILKKHQKI
jgi:hypothetical protein